MTREDYDYERHEREMERAEEVAWDRDHEPDPFGWQADREQARWERQMSERGSVAINVIFATLALAAFWTAPLIGYWCGVPIVAVALAWVAAGVGTVAKGERPRPCDGRNSNVCVAEGCYGEACVTQQEKYLRVLEGMEPSPRLQQAIDTVRATRPPLPPTAPEAYQWPDIDVAGEEIEARGDEWHGGKSW